MSDAALKRIMVALGVLVALYLATLLVPTSGGPSGTSDGGELTTWFEGIDTETVERIEIASPTLDPAIRLERSGASWSVNGHPADSGSVARLLTALADATVGDVMSTNPENHSRMGVSSDSATTLAVGAGASLDTLLVGAAGPGFGSLFARLPAEERVFLVDADLRGHATRDESGWRSKRMLALDTAAVTSVEVTRDGGRWALTRGDSTWVVDGSPANPTGARSMLQELASFLATGFADDETPDGPPDREVVARDAADQTLATLRLWARSEGGGDLLAVAEGSVGEEGTVYLVPSWRADRIAPAREDIEGDGG